MKRRKLVLVCIFGMLAIFGQHAAGDVCGLGLSDSEYISMQNNYKSFLIPCIYLNGLQNFETYCQNCDADSVERMKDILNQATQLFDHQGYEPCQKIEILEELNYRMIDCLFTGGGTKPYVANGLVNMMMSSSIQVKQHMRDLDFYAIEAYLKEAEDKINSHIQKYGNFHKKLRDRKGIAPRNFK